MAQPPWAVSTMEQPQARAPAPRILRANNARYIVHLDDL